MTSLPIPEKNLAAMVPLKPCARKDCTSFATGTLVLLVPYEGKTIPRKNGLERKTDMEPMQLFIGIEVCAQHGKEATAAEFVTSPMAQGVRQACIQFARPMPDFSRAIIGGRPLDDPEYIRYLAHMAAAKKLPEEKH